MRSAQDTGVHNDPESLPLRPVRTQWVEPRTAGTASAAPLPPARVSVDDTTRETPTHAAEDDAEVGLIPVGADPFDPETESAHDVEESLLEEIEPFAADALAQPDTRDLIEEEPPEDISRAESAETIEFPEGMRPVQTPLSVWELAERDVDTATDEHSARARQEWESFGTALAESLGLEEPGALGSAMQALADEITMETPADEHGVSHQLLQVADRIAYFATRLRTEGHAAIDEARASSDPIDADLANLASRHGGTTNG